MQERTNTHQSWSSWAGMSFASSTAAVDRCEHHPLRITDKYVPMIRHGANNKDVKDTIAVVVL
jgi:hypothetical protein